MNYRTEEMRAHWYIKANTSAFSKMTSVAPAFFSSKRCPRSCALA